MQLTIITGPAAEPVSLTEAKEHLRVTHSNEDTTIAALITAARLQVERYLRRALVTQTLELRIPCFETRMDLPRPPLQYVESVTYLDDDEALQTLDDDYYIEHSPGESHGYLQRAPNVSFPATALRDDAVRIRYVAGYPDTGSPTAGVGGVPKPITQAILLVIGDLFENREAQIVGTIVTDNKAVQALLAPYRDYPL